MIRRLLNLLISRLKGESYRLNEGIPVSYLLNISFYRFAMLFRGILVFCKKDGYFFLGPRCVIRCRSKLTVGKSVTIERGCYFDALSTDGIQLGANTSFGKNCTVECTGNLKFLGKGLKIGSNVGVGAGSFLGCAGGIEIKDDTIMGNYVTFHSENHNFEDPELPIRLQGVSHRGISVGRNCWIGAKATLLDGAIVEDGCIIAAGAVLKAGVYEANSIYGGVPAKFIKKRI